MRSILIALCLLVVATPLSRASLTLDECIAKAEANYPLIKKYCILDVTREIDLSDINKGWLPRVSVYAQGTAQNVVPSFPASLSGMIEQMGQEMKGLSKLQYKVGADVTQTVWDGGASAARRDVSRAQDASQRAALDVEMYALRQRVQNAFFALLLTEEQIAQSRVTHRLLLANIATLQSMYRNGTAMKADVEMMEAQALTVGQNITAALAAADSYRRTLALFIGENADGLKIEKPAGGEPMSSESARPELRLYDLRMAATEASRRFNDSSLRPKVGFFAQAYYGYPGLNYFESMVNRKLSFNLLAGVKVSLNIDAFYTRNNNDRRLNEQQAGILAEKETFLFNSGLQSASKRESIEGLRKVMADDEKIINLRANVRKAAESQLTNGVIDVTALLTKIADEDIARLTAAYHEIQLLQEIYQLKYILNQ